MGRPIPKEIKEKVLKLKKEGTPIAALAERFGVSSKSIHQWAYLARLEKGK